MGVPPVLLSWLPIGVVGSLPGEVTVNVPLLIELGGPFGGFVESADGGEARPRCSNALQAGVVGWPVRSAFVLSRTWNRQR